MNVAMGTLRRRQRASQSRQRNAEGGAVRERNRNSRFALVCFVLLGAAITFGVRTSWAPKPIKITTMKLPADTESRAFAENHTGRLFFDSLDGAICREMKFNNDTGRFSNERSIRCDDSVAKQDDLLTAPDTEARARASSLRSTFSGR